MSELTLAIQRVTGQELMSPCACMGPQNGEPLCPCAMRSVQVKDGRWVMPERDLGPVRVVPKVEWFKP
jgi:hypothetical protein